MFIMENRLIRPTSTYRQLICRILSMLVFIFPTIVNGHTTDDIVKGNEAVESGDYSLAVEFYSKVLAAVKEGKEDKNCCMPLEYGGNSCFLLNRYVEALDFYTYAIALAEKYGDRRIYANCMSNVGTVYAVFNDYERAAWYLSKAYEVALELKDRYLLAITAANLVKVYCYQGNIDKAVEYMRHQSAYPLEDSHLQQYFLNFNQGLIFVTQDNYKAGIYYLKKALDLSEINDMSQSIKSEVRYELGRVYAEIDQMDSALLNYQKVVEYDYNPQRELQALQSMARILREKGDTVRASRCDVRVAILSDSVFDRQQFNSARGRLLHYENERSEHKIRNLKSWIGFMICICLSIVTVLIVVTYYNRKLKSTQMMIIDKNRDLIRQNEELRQLRVRDSVNSALPEIHNKETPPGTTKHAVIDMHGSEGNKMCSVLGEQRVRDMVKKIEGVFANLNIILKPDFDLDTLANLIDSNTRYVSMVINGVYGVNFKTLLNKHRINEACRRLMDKDNYGHLTIAAIGEECGYSTVNNFIIAFKKINGMTPSQYQKLAER